MTPKYGSSQGHRDRPQVGIPTYHTFLPVAKKRACQPMFNHDFFKRPLHADHFYMQHQLNLITLVTSNWCRTSYNLHAFQWGKPLVVCYLNDVWPVCAIIMKNHIWQDKLPTKLKHMKSYLRL